MRDRMVFLSVKPRFAEMLLAGEKTVELRRVRPRLQRGDVILLYASSPTSRVVGYCHVAEVVSDAPQRLWHSVEERAAVSRTEYDKYFEGAARATGIVVERATALQNHISLADLRRHVPGFMPPQSFRYLQSIEETLRDALVTAVHRTTVAAV